MTHTALVVLGLWACVFCTALGMSIGRAIAVKDCADASVYADQPVWWQCAVELAKGRKNAAAIKAKGGGECER